MRSVGGILGRVSECPDGDLISWNETVHAYITAGLIKDYIEHYGYLVSVEHCMSGYTITVNEKVAMLTAEITKMYAYETELDAVKGGLHYLVTTHKIPPMRNT